MTWRQAFGEVNDHNILFEYLPSPSSATSLSAIVRGSAAWIHNVFFGIVKRQ